MEVTPVRSINKLKLDMNDDHKSYTNQKPPRENSGIRGWIEDSISKLSSSNTYTSLFENTLFTGSRQDESEYEERPKYKSGKRLLRNYTNINNNEIRGEMYNGIKNSRHGVSLTEENSMTSSMISFQPSTISIVNQAINGKAS